jgi:hypothetical protein
LDLTVSGQGPVAKCCECGDEPSGSCATELVSQYTLQCTLSYRIKQPSYPDQTSVAAHSTVSILRFSRRREGSGVQYRPCN